MSSSQQSQTPSDNDQSQQDGEEQEHQAESNAADQIAPIEGMQREEGDGDDKIDDLSPESSSQ